MAVLEHLHAGHDPLYARLKSSLLQTSWAGTARTAQRSVLKMGLAKISARLRIVSSEGALLLYLGFDAQGALEARANLSAPRMPAEGSRATIGEEEDVSAVKKES